MENFFHPHVELLITWIPIGNDFACEIRPSNIMCDNTYDENLHKTFLKASKLSESNQTDILLTH